MVKSFIHKLMLRRHFWRYATFDEVAELYASRMLRLAAIYIVVSFISIYLYQHGYSIVHIGFIWAAFFLLKVILALPSAMVVGWIGPKHATLIANLMYIPAMIGFTFVPQWGMAVLIPSLALQALSATMYSIAYYIDFSKVKSIDHAGKEIGYMNIIEKLTAGLSPLIGGFIAFWWGPEVTIILSSVLFALAAVPLLRTAEPVQTKVKLQFVGFPWRLLGGHSIAQGAHGFDVFSSGTAWSLYTAVIVIGIGSDNAVYAAMGLLLSVVFIAALIASYAFGKVIDHKKGGNLMRISAVANSVTHLLRSFAATPANVAGLNAANEVATTGYTMPYIRAVFDNADISGVRTTYLGLTEMIANFGASMAALTLALLALVLGGNEALHGFFFVAAGVVLLVTTARFPLYKR